MATTTSRSRRPDTLHAPDACSRPSSSYRPATNTTSTANTAALKPRSSSSGVNLDIRRAFAVAAAAAHVKAHSRVQQEQQQQQQQHQQQQQQQYQKHHHHHHHHHSRQTTSITSIATVTTTPRSTAPSSQSSLKSTTKPPLAPTSALGRPHQRKRSVDLDALIAPHKKQRLLSATALPRCQSQKNSPIKTPKPLKKQTQLSFKQSLLQLPLQSQQIPTKSSTQILSPAQETDSAAESSAKISSIVSPLTPNTAHAHKYTPAPRPQLLTPPASTDTVDQSKAALYSLDITTPCKKASAKPLPTTTQLPHTSASSSASLSSFSEAAAIVATRASKLAGGDVVARVKDRATSTASSASTDTETTPTSLPSRSGRKEHVVQAKAAGALHSGKNGRLNTAVSAKTAGKLLSANKKPRKDTSPTESASVSSESQETGGRKLRSQEVTGFKSELALYFPEYDVVIGNVQKEENALDVSTPILISGRVQNTVPAVKIFTDAAFTNVYDVQRLDLSSLNLGEVEEDSLPDIIYEPCHRKAERQEKSVRNTERCRAQHERDQVVRILDSLQGPDWLKMLGVTSASDSRRKSFEPARHHFIKACEAVLEKFRQWSAEEKRRKAEKERAPSHHAVEFPALMRDRSSGHSSGESPVPPFVMSSREDDGDGKSIAAVSVTSSNQDAVIEEQLYEETIAAEKSRRSRKRRGPGNASTDDETSLRKRQASPFLPTPPPAQAKEMTSFFAKRHERDAAVHRHRRGGRNILAFGQPLPDMVVQEFELPQALIDETSKTQNGLKSRRSWGKRDEQACPGDVL